MSVNKKLGDVFAVIGLLVGIFVQLYGILLILFALALYLREMNE